MGLYRTGYIDKDASQEEQIEILGGVMHNLNEILNRLSSDNVKKLDTERTKIASGSGSLKIEGAQIVMYDENKIERLRIGNNGSSFEFVLKNKSDEVVMGIDLDGELYFKG